MKSQHLKLAILDLYDGTANQGMRCIREIAERYAEVLDYQVFDVRRKVEIPGLEFDLYISTGGPGNPLEGDGVWDKKWHAWLESVARYNANPLNFRKKHIFHICHSFQMACDHFNMGHITARNKRSFGVMPIYKTAQGYEDPITENLPNPLYAVDARDWQVIDVDYEKLDEAGIKILAVEQEREEDTLPRAIMAARFTKEIFGTQFHPEADPAGMTEYYAESEKREETIDTYGEAVYLDIISHLNEPDKVILTHDTFLPKFIEQAVASFDLVVLG